MAAAGAEPSIGGRVAAALVSLATALVILGASMLPFFTPAWIHFEQDRAGAAALTGYARPDLDRATDSILGDLVFGGDYGVAVAGAQVLDAAERSHMRDVRVVFGGFAVVGLLAAAGLAAAALAAGSGARRAATWAAVRRGTSWLVVLLVLLGVIAVVAFDAAFETFHQVFFPGGNYNFDPRTEKLVQLFPEQFWSETALAYGAVAIATALGVGWYAGRRARAAGSAT